MDNYEEAEIKAVPIKGVEDGFKKRLDDFSNEEIEMFEADSLGKLRDEKELVEMIPKNEGEKDV